MAIFDARGRLVRELLRGEELAAGEHGLTWDGLDRDGQALAAGEYQWRMLRTPGFEARYITSLGVNPPTAAYDAWVGNAWGVSAIAVDQRRMYLGSGAAENVPVLLAQSHDGGQRDWQMLDRDMGFDWGTGPIALAATGHGLVVLQNNKRLRLMDADSGLTRWTVDLGPEAASRKTDIGHVDMDADDRWIVVTDRDAGIVQWRDPRDGSLTFQRRIDAPLGVAVLADGSALVVTGGAVVRAPPRAESPVEEWIPARRLHEPFRLSLDRQSGEVWVAEGSVNWRHVFDPPLNPAPADAGNRIRRFRPNGDELDGIGRPGGLRDGPYEPTDFTRLVDLHADGDGGLWTVELGYAALRRVAHFNRDGRMTRQWFGGQEFYNWSLLDPRDPTRAWFWIHYRTALMEARIDLERGRWEPIAFYRAHDPTGLLPDRLSGKQAHWSLRYWGDRPCLVNTGSATGLEVWWIDDQARRLRPLALAGAVARDQVPTALEPATRGNEADDAALVLTWTDRNLNAAADADEFTVGGQAWGQFSDPRHAYRGRHFFIDQAWNLFFAAVQSPHEPRAVGWYRLSPRHGPDQPPSWDWNDIEPAPAQWPDTLRHAAASTVEAISVAPDGQVFAAFTAERYPEHDRHGYGWPTHGLGVCRLLSWSARGALRFEVGRHGIADPHQTLERPAPPGHIFEPTLLPGVVRDCVILGDRVVFPATAWTRDGLYAGSFFDRRAQDGRPSRLYHWWRDPAHPKDEAFDGPVPYDCLTGAVVEADDGRVFWLPQGRQDNPLYQITGWDGWERQQGVIRLEASAPAARAEGQGLTGVYQRQTADGLETHRRVDPRLWFVHDQANLFDAAADWARTPPLPDHPGEPFVACWSGWIETPLTEPFTFSLYAAAGDRARLWLDGELVIDTQRRGPRPGVGESGPIRVRAGQRMAIQVRLDARGDKPRLSLNWESLSLDRQRVPRRFLYPD